jgi:hypothetical protein
LFTTVLALRICPCESSIGLPFLSLDARQRPSVHRRDIIILIHNHHHGSH